MELFQNRKDEQYLAKLVKNDDILENDCNLSVSKTSFFEFKKRFVPVPSVPQALTE